MLFRILRESRQVPVESEEIFVVVVNNSEFERSVPAGKSVVFGCRQNVAFTPNQIKLVMLQPKSSILHNPLYLWDIEMSQVKSRTSFTSR